MRDRCRAVATTASGRGPVADAGFTLLETMMSIFVIGLVMASLTSFFVTTVAVVNQQSGLQVATQVATSATSKIRSMKGSALATGRGAASSHAQWTRNPPVPGVPAYLADMIETSDPSAAANAGADAPLPTVGVPVEVNRTSYEQWFYVGRCWQPVGGGACGTGPAASGDVPFFRVVVAVTWRERRCAAGLCSYVTSTLVSSVAREPVFNSSQGSPPQAIAPPQAGGTNSAVSHQLSTTPGGQCPLTFSFSGLPPGVTGTSGGLLTGTLPATSGSHTVSVVLRDASNTVIDTRSFTWTVRPYPEMVTGDSPWAYHRGDDVVSSAATSTAGDASGNSRPGLYVGRTDGPSTSWRLDDGAGSTAADSSGAVNLGTLAGAGATWSTAGRSGGALSFDGTSGYVQAAGPAVTTGSSFTVAAWAKLASTGVNRTIVSQDGTTVSGFYLQYRAGDDRWCMTMLASDADAAPAYRACSGAPPTLHTWTHLTGVYDSAAGNVKLYVNGVLQATTPHTPSWSATGRLIVGGSKFSGVRRDPVDGLIDEVRTYRRALSATEISTLYGDAPSLQYDFEENAGTSVADGSGNANTGTLGSGVAWTTAGHTGKAAQFDAAATDYVSSTSAPVNAAASFSVSAWVNLNTSGAVTRTVLSQQGVSHSTFILKYESTGKWCFLLTTGSAGVADQVLSTGNATFNGWVHLVAVYDTGAAAGAKMKLYVNNGTPAVGPHATGYGTTNPLQVGRARWLSAWGDPWDGEIDDVRAYRRALTATEVATIYAGPVGVSPMTAGLPGALGGSEQSSTAVAFNGGSHAYNQTPIASPGPTTFTLEAWFKLAPGDAGGIFGYNTIATGLGPNYDRVVYVDIHGKLRFGVNPSSTTTVVSPLSYDDGAWHHVAATLSGAGMKLYVDGVSVATNPSMTTAASHAGYWRVGGTRMTGWQDRPNNPYFVGMLDEVAIYHHALTAQQIAAHYHSN